MRPLPLSLWLLMTAQIEAREQAQVDSRQPQPTAIRKMPADQGAKFHHEYCAFGDHQTFAPASHKPHAAIAARGAQDEDDARRIWANASAELLPRPPFALLSDSESQEESILAGGLFRRAALALASLQKRQWACPGGTSSCSSIGFPNSCCGEGEKCMEVPDTGLGPVGCCPAGATCGGGITECADGSTPCGSSIGGGCCIPGFVCQGVGCIRTPPNPPPPPPPLTTLTRTSTSIIPGPDPSTTIVTVIITITPSTSAPAITSTVTQTATAKPPPSSSPSQTTTTNNGAGAPFRPTSSPGPTNTNTYCPTGFYACLARAGGGCCQTGRDCATASCPPPAGGLTTVVNGHGVTVVVPAAGAPPEATTPGACASGWFLCGRDAGPVAGCCPRGYACGTASCVTEVTGGVASVAKGMPGNGDGNGGVW
ncbi:hypothetical protein B0I37DRAFT_446981 [Chaetomium sp. MPI-CAGE-AT-0009]|nr:hypothetical protein B0I37DRAFT_446981 [Chaetomium sp. MPI-CAGE-AT-0009]